MTTIQTVGGRSVRLRPVSAQTINELRISLRRKAILAGSPIEPPTYEAKTVTGETERHPHDETTLETDEDREAWRLHQEALAQLEAETNEALTRYMLAEGVICDDPPEEWAEKRVWLGLEVPESRLDQRMLYIQQEILRTPADLIRAIQGIMHLTARGSAEMEARLVELDDLFRRALEGTETAPEPGAGGVDVQP